MITEDSRWPQLSTTASSPGTPPDRSAPTVFFGPPSRVAVHENGRWVSRGGVLVVSWVA
ncbi:hypothetical protein ACOBQX_11315 [Actinokineospora sp. G85]|uniref:hypothetical protein n=1 Tax=Actinokineospora sp. G85 TaxID=3406626 RepID=UPI003C727F2F